MAELGPVPLTHVAGHAHLWRLPDGTGVHAPLGELVVDDATGRLCCHLCGRWFLFLGGHVRVHGYTAALYRAEMGLCNGQPLMAERLSRDISNRQAAAYELNPRFRDRLATASDLRRNGELAVLARLALQATDPPQRIARRRTALQAGRETQARRRTQELTARLNRLGYSRIDDYLRDAYAAGASQEELAHATGLGRDRLRTELDKAGITLRPAGHNTSSGRRSRARSAEFVAARRVGTEDLTAWLSARRAGGWTLTRLAEAVGHSSHWVRWRLDDA